MWGCAYCGTKPSRTDTSDFKPTNQKSTSTLTPALLVVKNEQCCPDLTGGGDRAESHPINQHTMVYEYNTPEYKYYSYLVISEQSSTRLLDCHFVMNESFVWAFSFSQELDPTMTEFNVSPVVSTSMIKLSSCPSL